MSHVILTTECIYAFIYVHMHVVYMICENTMKYIASDKKLVYIYFFYAALAKRSKVEFRPGFAYFNNNVDSKRHIIIRTAILYNEINSGQIMKNTKYVEKSPNEGKASE